MNTQRIVTVWIALLVCIAGLAPTAAAARYSGDVTGWVPWWNTEAGVEAMIDRLDELDAIYLFVYEVDETGELSSRVDLTTGVWAGLIEEARDERVDIFPTVMWFDGAAIHDTLTDRSARRALVRDIEDIVDDGHFDGVNIDFENKQAATKDSFSKFLRELEDALGRDELSCAIEARTPPESRWRNGEVPDVIEYANDYKAIDRYCDRVEIMAYDQMRADVSLNNARRGVPYNPVADIDWVEKVIELALEDIDEDKIFLGVPTYGRAYDVTVAPDWYRDYTPVASLDYSRVVELARKYDVDIGRTEGGEGFISYFPDTSPYAVFNQLSPLDGTPAGFQAAAKALLIANLTGLEIPVRIVTFADAVAIQDKLDLAEKYDLEGVALFRLDEALDKKLWRLF